MHTIYTASEEHVDPAITSSPVSVGMYLCSHNLALKLMHTEFACNLLYVKFLVAAMTISTRTSLNSVRTSSDPEGISLSVVKRDHML